MFFKRLRRIRRRHTLSDLDHVVGSWSKTDPITVRDLCQNIAIFGKTGSGKSSGSGDYLLRCAVGYPNSGGLWLASKPEDKDYAIRLFREAGRLDDLLIMEPGGTHGYRFNILEYEMRRAPRPATSRSCCWFSARRLTGWRGARAGQRAHLEGEEPRRPRPRHRDTHASDRPARPMGAAMLLQRRGAVAGRAGRRDLEESYHAHLLEEARQNCVTDIQTHDHEAARQHWTSAWPRLNDRTRSSVESGLFSLLHVFNTGVVRDLLATTTTISPDDLERRRWWFVNMPIVPGDATATFANTAVKLGVQRYILRRKPAAGDPLLCIFCDEFTKVANSYDSHTLNEIRSHKGAMITLTQSISGMYAHMHGKGKAGEHMTDALLGQYGHIVVHTADHKTAQFASETLGHHLELMPGGNPRSRVTTSSCSWGVPVHPAASTTTTSRCCSRWSS